MRILFAATAIAALGLAACGQDSQPAANGGDPAGAAAPAAPAAEEPADAPGAYAIPAGTPAHIVRAVQSPARTPAMTERDAGRKPAELLSVSRIQPGDRVAEIAGFGQYYTTLLVNAVGPEGHVSVYDLPYTEERSGEASRAFEAANENMDYIIVDYNDIDLPSDLDALHMVYYYHDLPLNDIDTAEFNRKVFAALRPGGIYYIVDHNAPAGTGLEHAETAHRIDPAVIRDEVPQAGFVLVEESDILRNPDDDLTAMVFAPGVRGHTDQSVFVFQKPE